MTGPQPIEVEGKRFVFLAEAEYERLRREASQATDPDLPPLPSPDRNGGMPAIAYARAAIAHDLIRARQAAGLTRDRLAELAGVRPQTIDRIESGRHAAAPRTVDRLTAAIASVPPETRRGSDGRP